MLGQTWGGHTLVFDLQKATRVRAIDDLARGPIEVFSQFYLTQAGVSLWPHS